MKYTKTDPAIETLEMCVQSCCEDRACNVAFMYEKDQSLTCFKLGCVHDSLCLPTLMPNATNTKAKRHTKMVLIRPFEHKAWSEVQITAQTKSDQGQSPGGTICEVGLDLEACQANEECVPLNEKSRNGACQCKAGFLRNNNGDCIKPGLPLAANVTTPSSNTAASSSTSTTQATPIQLTVQVTSKVVTLPDDSTILTAYAIPEAPTNRSYKYEWKLEKGNPGGTMENSHAAQLKLNHLVEGVYSFRVVVSGDDPPASGGALGNVTVLPAKRTNKPPTVVLQPSTQQINLPTSKAIIDASASVDDATPKDQLVFKWELKSEPLGYSKDLKETGPTLTLDDLIAGNYIIQVTVTDGDGAKSVVAEATIDVVPETDYPPTANAGEDIILYLPQREVTLYGNKSSDDHGISSWEWTRKTATGTEELAADTQNMRTPQATISNLEEGTYTFVLKVTDAKGQFSQDEVNVYVKAPTNLPPTANAGPDQEISLPKTWVILDGSASKDDVQVTKYNWTQISGPNQASFMTNNTGSANATGLTRGVYVFQLEVSDERNNTDQAQVTVTVNQDANSAPVADAGEDFAVTLPVNSVYLNGSLSKDDLKVTKWLWTRAPNSLAAGKIVGNTDVQPALLIADLVPGQYTFELQVWDEQGKSSSDSVTLTVKENPEKKNVVQAVFNADIASLTQTQLSNLIQGWVYYCIAVGSIKSSCWTFFRNRIQIML
ncbi:dyslexia-associated protein KIAA0319-like protein [Tigriopus californicus]|uniref:dyslexia-associated protein KIAA0319-like protein n=1 Tax=Tigriopus californicus TaxID=6832 RepID=UPI0027DA61BC|nr:dyslexia-associated protein KIAA0319-like protein [Tigriopus californicus]